MLTYHIALVPEADGVDLSELMRVSAAIQKQIARDFAPLWRINATVAAFDALENMPQGYWPIIVTRCQLVRESGVQLDDNGQPFAQIELSPHWSIEASRACLEMLMNPFGDHTTTGPSPRDAGEPVDILVEVCGPCGDPRYAYPVNDVLVSDFCTPAYFAAAELPADELCSFRGNLQAPFTLTPGGQLAWFDPTSSMWWRRTLWGDQYEDTCLGSLNWQLTSVRDLVRQRGPRRSLDAALVLGTVQRERRLREHAIVTSNRRAQRLRTLLGARIETIASTEDAVLLNDSDWLGIDDEHTVKLAMVHGQPSARSTLTPLALPAGSSLSQSAASSSRQHWVLAFGMTLGLLALATLSSRAAEHSVQPPAVAHAASAPAGPAAAPAAQTADAKAPGRTAEPAQSPAAATTHPPAARPDRAEMNAEREAAGAARAERRRRRAEREEATRAAAAVEPSRGVASDPRPGKALVQVVDPLAQLLDTRQ